MDDPTANTDKNNAAAAQDGEQPIPLNFTEPKPEEIRPAHDETQTRKAFHPIERISTWWHSQNRRWNRPKGEPAKWTDKAIVVLTAGIVFLAFMQLLEMHEGGKQTDRIIAADERIAAAMEGAVGQAKTSFEAANKQAILSQRAWVSF